VALGLLGCCAHTSPDVKAFDKSHTDGSATSTARHRAQMALALLIGSRMKGAHIMTIKTSVTAEKLANHNKTLHGSLKVKTHLKAGAFNGF
jgi:hypothetical protein